MARFESRLYVHSMILETWYPFGLTRYIRYREKMRCSFGGRGEYGFDIFVEDKRKTGKTEITIESVKRMQLRPNRLRSLTVDRFHSPFHGRCHLREWTAVRDRSHEERCTFLLTLFLSTELIWLDKIICLLLSLSSTAYVFGYKKKHDYAHDPPSFSVFSPRPPLLPSDPSAPPSPSPLLPSTFICIYTYT